MNRESLSKMILNQRSEFIQQNKYLENIPGRGNKNWKGSKVRAYLHVQDKKEKRSYCQLGASLAMSARSWDSQDLSWVWWSSVEHKQFHRRPTLDKATLR